jgi:hypothetical protein
VTDNPFTRPDDPYGSPDSGPNAEGVLAPVPLEVVAILERCWTLALSRLGVVVASLLIPAIPGLLSGVGSAVLQFLEEAATGDERTIYFAARMAVTLISMIIGVFFAVGQARIFTRVARGLDADVAMLFTGIDKFLPALVIWFVTSVAVGFGLVLCVVPGVVAWLGLQFGILAAVDQDLGPIEALGESWRIASPRLFEIFLVTLALSVLFLVFTCVTLGMGYLLALPVLALVQAVMYHTLLHEAGPRSGLSPG